MKIHNINLDLDTTFGKEGSKSREIALEEAWEEYNAQVLLEARKNASLTQQQLAQRIGVDKGYISKVERGVIIPSIVTFHKIISAMGLTIELKSLT